MAPVDLQALLQRDGIAMGERKLEELPERFPERFRFTPEGELTVMSEAVDGKEPVRKRAKGDALESGNRSAGSAWWCQPAELDLLDPREVLVLWPAGEPDTWQWTNLAEPTETLGRSGTPEDLGRAVENAGLVCVHGGRRAMSPSWRRHGLPLPRQVLDPVELSLLLAPGLDDRSVVGLARWLDLGDAATPPEVTAALRERFNPTVASLALSRRVLAHGGHPWARLLSAIPVGEDLSSFLPPASDELAKAVGPPMATSASKSADDLLHALADAIPDYKPRQSQADMALLVGAAMDGHGRLLVEAPTGTGKSLAYLAPAIGAANARPVVISTHTKMLQRQLRAEARRLREAGLLQIPFRQLQGVANYVCAREVVDALERDDLDEGGWLAVAVGVAALTLTDGGLWDDVNDRSMRSAGTDYWSTRATLRTQPALCSKEHCPQAHLCPMMARLDGIDEHPGVIAANHALVATWTADPVTPGMSTCGAPGGVLEAEPTALVLDEAHALEDALASAWTTELGAESIRGYLRWLVSRHGAITLARKALQAEDGDLTLAETASDAVDRAERAAAELASAAAAVIHEYGGSDRVVTLRPSLRNRPPFRAVDDAARGFAAALGALRDALWGCQTAAQGAGGNHGRPAGRACFGAAERATEMLETAEALVAVPQPHRFLDVLHPDDDAGNTEEDLAETWSFEHVPLLVGQMFRDQVVARADSAVLTSATLTVAGSFDFIAERLGLALDSERSPYFDTARLPSPFDHDAHSLVVLTNHLAIPTPVNQQEFVEDMAADQVGFLSLSHGRALTLFASRERMELTADLVKTHKDELAERGVSLLVQGDAAQSEIATRFRDDPGTALYGLRTYWEGFDAPGETLSYLFIEKPPYPYVGDPLVQARQALIADAGGDPFLDYVVPTTAITMTQGFGRLLRHESDHGAAIVYDRRMLVPSTATATILESLPTRNIVEAVDRYDAWSSALRFVTGEEPDFTIAILLQVDGLADRLGELRLEPGADPEAGLRRAATELFGIAELHEPQLRLMEAVLRGRDAVGVLPTGRGKSLCYQLPALVHHDQLPFVVVSPLVALIKDQVDELRSRKGFRAVAGLTGRSSVAEQTETLRDLSAGRVRLLYLSPERLVRNPVLQKALTQVELGAVVIDEAHCISAWGHDFRPEFRLIAPAVEEMPRSPRLALTATATREVQQDIEDTLHLCDPLVVREPTDRPDLAYWRMKCTDERHRTREMLRFVMAGTGRPGIIYASRRALTEQLAWVLNHAGIRARPYHAGLLPEQRESAQDDFLLGYVDVIVATKAFGMGINKPDIGWVLHYDIPDSLENYAQEAGRAARAPDLTAIVALLWHRGDIARRRRQAGGDAVFADVDVAEAALKQIADSPRRGNDALIDPDELAEHLAVNPDELNVVVAWLEQAGAVRRLPDCSSRGVITLGRTEPADRDERRQFVTMLLGSLRCRLGSRRLIDLAEAADKVGLTPDELEARLITWSLARHLTFQSTRRLWRIRPLSHTLDLRGFREIVDDWRAMQNERLESMVRYVNDERCRRVVIAEQFGDPPRTCTEVGGQPCDVCSGERHPWHHISLDDVPDPEEFVDVRLAVLQMVQWASRNTTRPFGEGTLKAVALGQEARGQHPISPAALSCPQFGVLRHVRSAARRYDEELSNLLDGSLVERFLVRTDTREWWSLRATAQGRRELGVERG